MMASLSSSGLFRDGPIVFLTPVNIASFGSSSKISKLQTPFMGAIKSQKLLTSLLLRQCLQKKPSSIQGIRCIKQDGQFDPSKIQPPPYSSYFDSTSGQLEPASGARASIPGREYWPEGTASRVAAARAPEPVGTSNGKPSYGKNPGSRRKKYKGQAMSSKTAEATVEPDESQELETSEPNEIVAFGNHADDYVIYQTEPEQDNRSSYELDKEKGRPHPFLDPASVKPIEEPRTSEDLWWNWRKPEKEQWSRWQRRRPDVDTVFAKAMAETGQIKLFGDHPTQTETALTRARRHIFKEERLQAEQRRLEEIGPIAFYSEWVKAWDRDTSWEAVQKHYEETGEDENTQLITMFQRQTAEEYRIMMGTDIRIKRDPLAMRMREELIKEIWGGDPVYPTINYIQDPDEVIDFRGPDFHEPTPDMLPYLMEHGKIIPREELEKILAKEKTQELEITEMDEAMASAVDIGESDDEEESEVEENEVGEKITRNWSVLKTTPQPGKPKKKEGQMSLEEAIDDSENLTDFLMDFDEEE